MSDEYRNKMARLDRIAHLLERKRKMIAEIGNDVDILENEQIAIKLELSVMHLEGDSEQ